MSELKINTIYSGYGESHADVTIGELKLRVEFSDSEHAEVQALALRAFQRQQQALAREIADATVPALPTPDTIDADFDEVPF